jgi:hypothetical protein
VKVAWGSVALLRESSAALVGHEERTYATDQADDSDCPEHGGTYELETSETRHHQEDDARDEESEADEVDSHSLLRLGGAVRRNVPQLGDWLDVPAALSLVLSPGANAAYVETMGDHRPARTVIGVRELPKPGVLLTMNLTAVTAD